MLKRLSVMTLQNLLLSFRNSLVWVLFGTLILMIVLVQFFMPKEYSISQAYYVLDNTVNKTIESVLDKSQNTNVYFVKDQASLEDSIKSGNNTIGILFDGTAENPEITLSYQGKIGQQNLNVIKSYIGGLVSSAAGKPAKNGAEVRFLRGQNEPVPKNLTFVSVLMVFEVLILGFLLVAVFLFQEKSDGSIRAYRVTPGGTFAYISAKTLAFLLIGLVYGGVLTVLTMGFHVNYLELLMVTVFGFLLYTLIGMIIAAFFNNISEWFFIGIAVLFINMAPVFSHEFPAFSPGWITWFPSYSVLLCYDEIFFPSGKSLLSPIAVLVIETFVAYVVCHFVIDRKLMKEGR